MNRSSVYTILVLLAIVAMAAFFAFKSGPAGSQLSDNGDDIPVGVSDTAYYTDLNQNEIDLSMYDGQVRVINSWASWCSFCVRELPDLERLATEYKEQGVAVLAINRGESARLAKNYIETLPSMNNLVFVLDQNDAFYRSIGGFGMPETVFYDQEGTIVVHKRGFMTYDEMKTHLETTLAAVEAN